MAALDESYEDYQEELNPVQEIEMKMKSHEAFGQL